MFSIECKIAAIELSIPEIDAALPEGSSLVIGLSSA
jgi:hypothetical protein